MIKCVKTVTTSTTQPAATGGATRTGKCKYRYIYSNNHCLADGNSDTLNVTYVMNMPILRHYFSDDLRLYLTLIMQSTLILLYVPSYHHYLLKGLTFSIMLKKRKNLHLISIKPSTLQLMTRNYMPH